MDTYFAGVDIGSTNSKACIINIDGIVLGYAQNPTKANRQESGCDVYEHALSNAGINDNDVSYVGATGYGRRKFERADIVYPEVICHAIGAEHLFPNTRTVLDVGGQDCKIIQCHEGIVLKFEMNDKCAAGTGRFFEVLSENLLKIPIDQLSDLAEASKDPVRISSMCTVFAESEVVSMLSQGVSNENISRGMIEAMFRRIKAMAGAASIPLNPPLVFMGGVARCKAAKSILEDLIGMDVLVPEVPQLPASLGIAIMARDEWLAREKADEK